MVHPRRRVIKVKAPQQQAPVAPAITAAQVLVLPPESVGAQGFAVFLKRGGIARPATKRQASLYLRFPQYRKLVAQSIAEQQAPVAVPVAA